MIRGDSAARGHARCPRCRKHISWEAMPHRPFCSLPCRLIDLGAWLDERYRIAGTPLPEETAGDNGGLGPGT